MDATQEHLYAMALTQVVNVGVSTVKILYETLGSATAVYENRRDLRSYVPEVTERLSGALSNIDYALKRAEQELDFIGRKNVRILAMNDDDYPQRLRNCTDAPLVLYYCGSGNMNCTKVVSMVGTRKCTEYGKDICRSFVDDLKHHCPDVLVVSGLAYGIDIHSHRAALDNGLNTVGVLAHGLDRIYPSVHRSTAVEMVRHGGLLTEYMSGTTPEKGNFVSRNRIVAGMADACIVVESAAKGGSLITANIAHGYGREVFSFPGRIYDEQSAGCNRLIKENKAVMIESAEDFVKSMGWESETIVRSAPVQRELFVELSAEEQMIVNSLKNVDDKPMSMVVNETGLAFNRVSVLMFELEMKNVAKVMGGGRCRLINN